MNISLNKHDIAILKWLYRVNQAIYQSDIPKLTGLDSKTVTKSLYKLEKANLVDRKTTHHNKRKTYLIKIDRDKVLKALREYGEDVFNLEELYTEISNIPCISCPHINRCYVGGFNDPLYCQLLANYLEKD